MFAPGLSLRRFEGFFALTGSLLLTLPLLLSGLGLTLLLLLILLLGAVFIRQLMEADAGLELHLT